MGLTSSWWKCCNLNQEESVFCVYTLFDHSHIYGPRRNWQVLILYSQLPGHGALATKGKGWCCKSLCYEDQGSQKASMLSCGFSPVVYIEAPTSFYYAKDIAYLAHEPILKKLREHKAFAKKLARALGRGEWSSAKSLEDNKPVYRLDHIIKER